MIESNGLPATLLTAMTAMAKVAGANRIVASGLIPHPVGDPSRARDEELQWREERVRKALGAAATAIDEAQIFPEW
jgi:glycine/betaine/sarcosine/D-proline reductase family selenoprotein B